LLSYQASQRGLGNEEVISLHEDARKELEAGAKIGDVLREAGEAIIKLERLGLGAWTLLRPWRYPQKKYDWTQPGRPGAVRTWPEQV